MPKTTAAIYIRVSTAEQALKGYSLSAQEEKLRRYADYKGYEIENVYCDDGYSGKDLNRPAISRLIDNVKAKRVDIVLVYRLDRISRRVRDVIDLVDIFIGTGVQLYSLHDNIDLATPMGRAMLKVSATWSELERETIIERTTMGKRQRALSGKMMCTGAAPFGYEHDKANQRFIIKQDEAEMVREIFRKYLAGMNLRDLNDYMQIKYRHPYFSNPMSCKPILHRLMYTGYYAYDGEIVKATNYDPIITLDLFYKAQERARANRSERNYEDAPYLLTGLVYCARCGRRYYGKRRKRVTASGEKIYTSYGCGTVLKPERNQTRKCDNIQYSTQSLDDYVIQAVKSLKWTNLETTAAFDTADYYVDDNIDLKRKRDRLLDLFLNEDIDKATFTERAEKIDKQIEQNNRILANLSEVSDRPDLNASELHNLIEKIETFDKRKQQTLLRILIERILIDGENVSIKFRVK